LSQNKLAFRQQAGIDNSGKPETYATALVRKMYDCSDGLFFANVYFD